MNTLWWQLKDEYARCKWSEQCHICASERWFSKYGIFLLGGVCLLAVSQAGLTEFFGECAKVTGRVVLCLSLIVTILAWTSDQQYTARVHNDAANCYYELGQKYISLMLKICGNIVDQSSALDEHKQLGIELARLSSKFPKTSSRDYSNAKKRIDSGRLTFGTQKAEIDDKGELDMWFSPELRGELHVEQ